MSRVAESGSVNGRRQGLAPQRPPKVAEAQNRTGPTVSHRLIHFYRRHLTRFTPKCGRAGPSCSQIALDVGLIAGLVAFTHCDECRGRGA